MNDRSKTKAELIDELQELRRRLADCADVSVAPSTRGTWLVDTDFVVRVADEAMCELLTKSGDDVIGSKCHELMDGPRCHTEGCVLRQAFARSGSVVEERSHVARVPMSCRVIGHLVYDRGREAAGIAARFEAKESPKEQEQKPAATAERTAPLLKIEPQRFVLLVASPKSKVRGDWASLVRRAGYTVTAFGAEVSGIHSLPFRPAVAVLDLAVGEPLTDQVHRRLRKEHPQMPIIVVSSSRNHALEARRWKRSNTWYVPRSVRGDELVRLIEDVTPRPVLRTRPER